MGENHALSIVRGGIEHLIVGMHMQGTQAYIELITTYHYLKK